MTMSPRCDLGEQRAADWPLFDRDRTGYAALDQHLCERHPVHERVALDLAPLHVEALAFGLLPIVETLAYP